ncbi:MAG: DEAD/DEAH box helicase [Phycisphaerales bacterium JB050]
MSETTPDPRASSSRSKRTTKRTPKKAPASVLAQTKGAVKPAPQTKAPDKTTTKTSKKASTKAKGDSSAESKPSGTRPTTRKTRDLKKTTSKPEATETRKETVKDTVKPPYEKAGQEKGKPQGKTDKKWEEIFAGKSFEDIGLRGTVRKALAELGFKSPTKIQAEMVPLVLAGKDVLGQSRTGSGKTAAFGLPVINNCIRGLPFQAVILAPTRELAIQITDELRSFAKYTPLKMVTVYGGQKIDTQAKSLAKNPEIIVATPGRYMDMIGRGYLNQDNIRFVVLDEVDRMLDIGFRDDIRKILSGIRGDHQTVFVSATISPEIESLGRAFMKKDAERLETVGGSLTVSLVDQYYFTVEPWDKSRLLRHVLKKEEPELALVFCRMKRTVDKITEGLRRSGINAAAIHGDLPQGKRNQIMEQLHAGELHILVASDLAARGLDVDGITHVINFDLPEDPEIYVHRIGRTARAGRGGVAFSFVSPDQGALLTEVELLANTHVPARSYDDFEPGPVPSDVEEQRKREAQRREMLSSKNRYKSAAPEVPAPKEKIDASKFPGGVVPTKLPPRRMGGKISRGR